MKNGEKAQGSHKAYATRAFSSKLQKINTKDKLNDESEIGKVTICDKIIR